MGPASPSLCGFLVLDKPAGLTSHACVARVRRAFGLRRVGHGGTLDPAVSGVLPIAVGPATRLLPYLSGDKLYRGVVQLGIRTSTDDLEGEVLARASWGTIDRHTVEVALADFRGTILQRPPLVSAVHVDGERAYVRARRGESPVLAAREVTISRLELLGLDLQQGRVELEVQCTAGTYIRSLARDLGEALGCGAALARLRRHGALGFGLERAVPLERLDEDPLPRLIDPLEALPHLARHHLGAEQLRAWRCGRSLSPPEGGFEAGSPVAVVGPDGILAGIARAEPDGLLRPRLVFDAAG